MEAKKFFPTAFIVHFAMTINSGSGVQEKFENLTRFPSSITKDLRISKEDVNENQRDYFKILEAEQQKVKLTQREKRRGSFYSNTVFKRNGPKIKRNVEIDSAILINTLDNLNSDESKNITQSLSFTLDGIRNVLEGEDDEDRKELSLKLTSKFAYFLVNASKERAKIEAFVNVFFAPNQVSSSFFCAWATIVGILQNIYQSNFLSVHSPRRNDILKEVRKPKSTYPQKYIDLQVTMNEEEFITYMGMYAPKLDGIFIKKIADHMVPDYQFRGMTINYYEKLTRYYRGWIDSTERGENPFSQLLQVELKKRFGEEHWIRAAQELSVIAARNFIIGNHISHVFWDEYHTELSCHPGMEFDDILNSKSTRGWYYTEKDVTFINLLANVSRMCGSGQSEITLGFEPFLEKPEIGMPQMQKCSYSKRDFKYFFKHWYGTSISTPAPIPPLARNLGE